MRIVVDQVKCHTLGICVMECPEVFRFQEGSKKAISILPEIPPELQEKVRKVARMCPNEAILIKE